MHGDLAAAGQSVGAGSGDEVEEDDAGVLAGDDRGGLGAPEGEAALGTRAPDFFSCFCITSVLN